MNFHVYDKHFISIGYFFNFHGYLYWIIIIC